MRVALLCSLVTLAACGESPETSDAASADADDDGVADERDNCPDLANADQADDDEDGIGDACTCGTVVVTSDADLLANRRCVSMTSLQVSGGEIASTAGLDRLVRVTDQLTVSGATRIQSLEFPSLEQVERLRVSGCINLTTFAGLEDVQPVHLEVRDNNLLASLDGLAVADEMEWLLIEFNQSLQSIAALEGVRSVSTLTVTDNQLLVTLDGFQDLETSDGSLYLARLPLTTLAPLGSLRSTRHFGLVDLSTIPTLDGLQALETVTGDLTIWRADQLTSLDALTSLTSVGLVDIDDNPLLPQCDVEAFATSLSATCDCDGNAACP